jgi:hypothetical protein
VLLVRLMCFAAGYRFASSAWAASCARHSASAKAWSTSGGSWPVANDLRRQLRAIGGEHDRRDADRLGPAQLGERGRPTKRLRARRLSLGGVELFEGGQLLGGQPGLESLGQRVDEDKARDGVRMLAGIDLGDGAAV